MDNEKKLNIIILYVIYILIFTEVLLSSPEFLNYEQALLGWGICFGSAFILHIIAHKKLNALYLLGATINYAGFGLLCSTYNSYLARKYDTGLLILTVIAAVVLVLMIVNIEYLTTSDKRASLLFTFGLAILIAVSLFGWLVKDLTFCSYTSFFLFIVVSCLYVCYTLYDPLKNICYEISIGSFLLPVIVVKLIIDKKSNR